MPNWTTNAVAIRRKHLGKFVRDGRVDFNLMRPMPESLNIVSGSIERNAIAAATGTPEEKLRPMYPYRSNPDIGAPLPFDVEDFEDLRKLGEVYLENEREHGARTWYDWCWKHWGTKWNACKTHVDIRGRLAIVMFDTAWSRPSLAMFDEAFSEKGVGRYYIESHDEDFDGVYGRSRRLDRPRIFAGEARKPYLPDRWWLEAHLGL